MAYTRNPTWQDGEGLTLIRAVHLNTIEDGLVAAAATADSAVALANTKADATRQIIAGTGLSGGGSLTVDRTLAVVYGTTAGTAAQGNDSRLSDARTPVAHTQAASTISDSTAVGRSVLTAADAAPARTAIGAGTSSLVLGTGAGNAAAGNDARFGSPAGWVNATTIADGTDLDTLTNAGMYARTSGVGTTTVLHYPSDGFAGFLEVVYAGSQYIMQRFTSLTMGSGVLGPNRAIYTRVKFGASWTAWMRDQLQGDIGGGDALGIGSPEGVLAAPVGTYYTDTAGTNGIWRWLKVAGVSNTGWAQVPATWTNALLLATSTDINTVLTPGIYYRANAADVGVQANDPYIGWAGPLEVIQYFNTSYIMQRATRGTAFSGVPSGPLTYQRMRIGGTWGAWQPMHSQGVIGGGDAVGTGSPEGVVTAPVGTYYTDTASTNGATRWYKATGSGNTGWKVVIGDTGWRDTTSLLPAGLANSLSNGHCVLRRNGDLVTYSGLLSCTAAGISTIFALPVGFRVANANVLIRPQCFTATSVDNGLPTTATTAYVSTSGLRTASTIPNPGSIEYDAQWITNDAWPTALPGTAAP